MAVLFVNEVPKKRSRFAESETKKNDHPGTGKMCRRWS
jgi:hypothetical protein